MAQGALGMWWICLGRWEIQGNICVCLGEKKKNKKKVNKADLDACTEKSVFVLSSLL